MVKLTLLVILAGERPFFCPSNGCEKTFSTQYSLKSHMKGHDNKGHLYNALPTHNGSEVCSVFSLALNWAPQNSNHCLCIKIKGQNIISVYLLVRGKKLGPSFMSWGWGGRSQKSHQTRCFSPWFSSPFLCVGRGLETRGLEWLPEGQPDAPKACIFPCVSVKWYICTWVWNTN